MPAIVVGYDGSDSAKRALEVAVGFARDLGDRLVIVSSYEVNPLGGEVKDMAVALKERAAKIVEEGAGRAGASVEVESLVASERAAEALTEVAESRNARLIIVGSHGESPLKGAILGSTSHKLLHISNTPVLVVPAN